MKITIAGIAGLIIVATVMFAQNRGGNDDKMTATVEYIRRETVGGKLDFTAGLKGPGFLPVEHKGVRFNRNDYPVFLWGEAVSDLGLRSTDQAADLWEEIHGKKLTGPQRTALRIGFGKKLK